MSDIAMRNTIGRSGHKTRSDKVTNHEGHATTTKLLYFGEMSSEAKSTTTLLPLF